MKEVRELILVRHGMAEDKNVSKNDSERQLIPEGEEQLKKIFRCLNPYFKTKNNIWIWTSPMARAMQTGKILSYEIEGCEISAFNFISSGDYDSMAKTISRCEKNSMIIIVGHEPYLSEWTEKICKKHIAYKKGGVACIKIKSTIPLGGKLKWSLQPKIYENGILTADLDFPKCKNDKNFFNGKEIFYKGAEKLLMSGIKEMAYAQKKFIENPDEPESCHQFRVKVRQLISIFSFLKPEIKKTEYKYFQKRLHESAKKFAYLREIDVIMTNLGQDYPAIHEKLKEDREAEKGKIFTDMTNKINMEIYFEILAWMDKRPFKHSKSHKKSFISYSNKRMRKWILRFEEELKSIDFSNIEEVHKLRIKGKKIRYLSSMLREVLENEYESVFPKFKEMQDRLGEICDRQREIQILEKLKNTAADEKIRGEIDNRLLELK